MSTKNDLELTWKKMRKAANYFFFSVVLLSKHRRHWKKYSKTTVNYGEDKDFACTTFMFAVACWSGPA